MPSKKAVLTKSGRATRQVNHDRFFKEMQVRERSTKQAPASKASETLETSDVEMQESTRSRSPLSSPQSKPASKRQKQLAENATPVHANRVTGVPVTAADHSTADADDSTVVAGTGRQTAAVDPKTLFNTEREHWIYFDLTLKVAKSTSAIEENRRQLAEWFRRVQEVDDTAILCRYGQDPVFNIDVDILGKPEDIPRSINKINQFFNGFRPKSEGGSIYVSILIGFDYPEENFQYDVNAHTDDAEMKIYKKALQTAHAACIGWLHMSHGDMDLQDWTLWFERQIRALQFRDLLAKDPQAPTDTAPKLRLGLKRSFLWDGSKKGGKKHNDKYKNGMKSAYDGGQRAVFVEFEKAYHELGYHYFREVLKSEAFAKRCNIPMQLIPKYSYGLDPKEQQKVKHTIQLHGKVLACLERDFNEHVYNIDARNDKMANLTLRELILGWKLTNSKGVEDSIIKAIDPKWGNEDGWTFTFPAMEDYQVVARHRIKHLGPYLIFKYGVENVELWLLPAAKVAARVCEWNAEEERVVSAGERDCESAEKVTQDCTWFFENLPPVNEEQEVPQRPQQLDHLMPDQCSVSTFHRDPNGTSDLGGVEDSQRPAASSGRATNSHRKIVTDEESDLSSRVSTVFSRVSQVEQSLVSMEQKMSATMNTRFGSMESKVDSRMESLDSRFAQLVSLLTQNATQSQGLPAQGSDDQSAGSEEAFHDSAELVR